MNFFKDIFKASMLFFTIGIFVEIGSDLIQNKVIELGIADVITIFITGFLSAIIIVSLSLSWKKYYANKKPQN